MTQRKYVPSNKISLVYLRIRLAIITFVILIAADLTFSIVWTLYWAIGSIEGIVLWYFER